LKALLVTGDFSVSFAIRDLEDKLKELVFLVSQSVLKLDGLKRGKKLLVSFSSLSVSVFSEIQFFLF